MESIFKSKSDMDKFDLARELKNKANTIRATYYVDMKNTESNTSSIISRQHATALYLIDNLALRVGGKKDTSEKADTVGVTSLRVEHITILEDDMIKLDFLGKDSVRYCKKVKIDNVAYNNIKYLVTDKSRKDLLFDKISPTSLNQYLDSIMKGLTAKVWRTYNASMLFQKELNNVDRNKLNKLPEAERINYLISVFNQANTSVAVLCNHQKNVSSNIETTLEKIDNTIKNLKNKKLKMKKKKSKKGSKEDKMIQIKKIEGKIEILKMKKDTKIKMKNVSLGTSKNNYIDPRIIFSFMKKYNIPEDKLFNKALLSRFEWARNVPNDYSF